MAYLDKLKSAKYIVWFHDGSGKWDPMPSESKDNVREIIEANKPEDDGPYEYVVTCPKVVLTEAEQAKHGEAVRDLFRKGREVGRKAAGA